MAVPFERRLVLANWMLNLFEVARFEDLAKHVNDPMLEGFDDEGISKYHQALRPIIDLQRIPNDRLLEYDGRIVKFWKAITSKRNQDGQVLYPKYFQYLSLLFTEVYLDYYFNDADALLKSLNSYLSDFNAGKTGQQVTQSGQLFPDGLPADAQMVKFEKDDLKKLAFWSATGSGKTLLMHINILQYREYLKKLGREKEINRVILLTPNEGLSKQHQEEFILSGMKAELFNKDSGRLFAGQNIEIIDIHKLKETSGDKTVSIDAFEGNNLVLVDEGHRGTSGTEVGIWMERRNRLCEKGFSFEYSATFGQAMKASGNRALANEYAKCILFDYSYKYFYADGYGKEYRILNLEDDRNEEHRTRYLTACLLAFYQQQKLFLNKTDEIRPYLIEKPLWIFVGGSVTKKPSKKDVSDVVDILLFLANFVKKRSRSIDFLNKLLMGDSGIHNSAGQDIFAGAYTYLGQLGMSGEQVYKDILKVLFNTTAGGALHVKRLPAGGDAEGEVALHIGEENDAFGLINVGDPTGLAKLCEEHPDDLAVTSSEFSKSMFRQVNSKESTLNILIGSKKFSEGWSSWRVSTMGLMNVGKKEGSQIIQLFGRGVRLKGKGFSLKRSKGISAPREMERLETLNVFGVQANYMKQFKDYLEEEGLPSNEDRIELVLPVIKNLGASNLKTIKVKEGVDFKKQGQKPTLGSPDSLFKRNPVVLDWYPKVQSLASTSGHSLGSSSSMNEEHFQGTQIAFLDFDAIYFDLQQMKSERAWYNLNLSKDSIRALLEDHSWYTILIPQEEMLPTSFEKVRQWQELASSLLRKYCERYYKHKKAAFEKDHLEYQILTADDPNFIEEYRFLVDKSRADIVSKLHEIAEGIGRGELSSLAFQGLHTLAFDRHLYQHLIHITNKQIEVKPVPLNEGEKDFVSDLQKHYDSNKKYFANKELYLLRNMSRGKGIGFFEAGNFYPDFILWLLDGSKQYINFIDPKGIRNLKGPTDPKIQFYSTVKTLESDLKAQDPNVVLNSFIIANTRLSEVAHWNSGMGLADFAKINVYFQSEEQDKYIGYMMDKFTA